MTNNFSLCSDCELKFGYIPTERHNLLILCYSMISVHRKYPNVYIYLKGISSTFRKCYQMGGNFQLETFVMVPQSYN